MNTKKAIAIVLLIIATVLVLTGCVLSNKPMGPCWNRLGGRGFWLEW